MIRNFLALARCRLLIALAVATGSRPMIDEACAETELIRARIKARQARRP